MYKIVKKSRAIQTVLVLFILAIMITIFPVRTWKETIPSVSNQILAGSSDSIGEDYMLQRFIAQYNHLGTINLYIADFDNGWNKDQRVDSFIFRMLDSDMQVMFEQKVDVRFIDIPGFCPIYINEDLEVGRDYYFFLQGEHGSRVWFGLEETEKAGTQYVSRLVYNYDQLEGYNIVGEYYYSVPLRKDKIFIYDAILLLVGALLVGAVELYFRISKKDKLITVEKAFRYTANILVTTVMGIGIYMISLRRFFSGQFIDNLFYTIGLLFTGTLLFYAINRKRDRSAHVPLVEKWKTNGANYMQAAFIAGALWACCNYMNGLYDIHHRIAERQFIVFFALMVLTMCKKKEIFSKVSIVYVLAAAIAVYRYHSIYADYIAMDKLDIQVMRYGILAAVLAGFVGVTVITRLIMMIVKKEKMGRLSLWYGALLTLFFVLLIVFRNTRGWIITLVVSFVLFYIRYAFWDKKEHLLQNISNGLILHFILTMVFVLLHRPFLAWVYPRFPFVFHTVTVTAVYMTFVMCAALMKLMDKYGESHKLKDIWKELLVLGMSGTYMLFTASRTGFLAVAAMMAVGIIMATKGKGKEKVINILRLCGLMILSIIWCFPMIFTGQRIRPAIVNDVHKYEVEVFPDAIARGNEWDSMYYITIERFAEVFNNKIFGIAESGTISYERSEEYQKYRAKRFNNKGEVVWEGGINELYSEEESGSAVQNGTDAPGLTIIGTKTEEERVQDEERAKELQQASKGNFEETPQEEEVIVEETSVYEKTEEYANGRMDIFRAYIRQLNLEGHDEMGAILEDGSLAVHAHNIYLQVAYDHGIFVGIVFIIVGGATFVQGCIFFTRRKKDVPCAAMPAVVIVAFAMAGLVEWIFHLCHPAGFTLLLVLAPLLFDMGGKKDKANEKR